ncbi:MAG: phosphatidate cytidylyltransferase [candidate division KSB1 bacterium]|nr:phosphatidate cytidylyltransferase [candidate division KSB1 bacterium]
MTKMDWLGLIASYLYAFGILALFENVGKKYQLPQFFTRKLTHLFAGLWTWGVLMLFENKLPGLIPYASFIILNYLFYRKQTYGHMDSKEDSPGTVYFAVSITLCMAFLWNPHGPADHVSIAMAGIMAMTLGDAMAALIGRYMGKHSFTCFNATKTLEGSAAMLVFSAIGIFISLWVIPGSPIAPDAPVFSFSTLLVATGVGAVVATVIEAVSLKGLDNLTVPLATAALLYLLWV